jgi:hypothetical protein
VVTEGNIFNWGELWLLYNTIWYYTVLYRAGSNYTEQYARPIPCIPQEGGMWWWKPMKRAKVCLWRHNNDLEQNVLEQNVWRVKREVN